MRSARLAAAAARPETGSGLAPNPSATRHADVYPSVVLPNEDRHSSKSAGMIHAGLPEGHDHHPRIGKKLEFTDDDARMAYRAIFQLADAVQRQIRKELQGRKLRT